MLDAATGYEQGLSALHRFARSAKAVPRERCELCSAPIAGEHRHLLEVAARGVDCVCRPCALLFDRQAAALGKFRLIPERRLRITDFRVEEGGWQKLGIPVGLAYLASSTAHGEVSAAYPGPAGAVEAEVDAETWDALLDLNPLLRTLEPDVEALLVNRVRENRLYFIAPIDDCFRLIGLIRSRWRGLTGGTEVWEEVGEFFKALEQRSEAVQQGAEACA